MGVSYAALAEHVQAAADLLELTERDRVLFFASPSFDVSLEELLPALVRGATVVLRGAELWPPSDFSRIAGELALTVADLPTAYWRQWVRESPSLPPSLRMVTVGGEAMPVEEAIGAPRVHVDDGQVHCEGGCDPAELDRLESLGYELIRWRRQNLYFGGVSAVERRDDGGLAAAGDPRRGGHGIVVPA